MAKNSSTTLVDTLLLDRGMVAFVDERVRSGRYESAGEVVWAGLRLLEDQEARVSALQDALVDGENSGKPQPFDFEEFKTLKRAGFTRNDS